MSAESTARRRIVDPVVYLLDAFVLLFFAGVGRDEHDSGPLTGLLDTAWPFLAGAAIGHLIAAALHREPITLRAGVIVWASTVVGGMLLRQVTGDGTAFSFIVVTTCFTGFFLIGWRVILLGWMRRRGEE
ncbi:DUF3054 domain-containing protein [Nocardioides sp. Bht2]|uniref:DUF3054 domain-containing protein n=1 Tax=Nocardioides sp. Bht2 TaxID=3392297 RepID=UPI0039B5557D